MEKKNITSIVEDNLCTGCGTCISLCPKNAIMIKLDEKKGRFIPELDENSCNSCGICYAACPGKGIDYKQFNLNLFGKEPENILVGNFLNAYAGYSNNTELRNNSSSGGLITQILVYALENKIIDGALVTRMKKNKPLEPEPFVARTKEEIIEAAQSKYCPVPANIALKEILDAPKEERFAVVGLPCHINGIREAEQINKKLKEKIVLHIGLMCNHTPNFWATKLFLEKQNINEKDLLQIKYRGNGWPGYMEIQTHKNKIDIPLPVYWKFIGSQHFYLQNCLTCNDGIAELADISFGDAWLPEYNGDNTGTSICLIKNTDTKEILMEVKSAGEIELEEIDVNKIIESQSGMLYMKKVHSNSMKKFIKKAAENNQIINTDTIDDILAYYFYLNYRLSSYSITRKMLRYIPIKLIHLYSLPYKILINLWRKNKISNFN